MMTTLGQRVLLAVLIAFAGYECVERGVLRAVRDSGDLLVPVAAARTWLRHGDPYDADVVQRTWMDGSAPHRPIDFETTPLVYPPTSLPLLAPLVAAEWDDIRIAVLLLQIGLVACAVAGVASIAGFGVLSWRGSVLVALAMAMAPLHTGLAKGNLGVTTAALSILSLWAASAGRTWIAGLLLGTALALKPTVGGPLIALYVMRRDMRTVTSAIIAVAALAAVTAAVSRGGAPLAIWSEWWGAVARTSSSGAINDPSSANPSNYQLINLEMPLRALSMSPLAGRIVALCGVAMAFLGVAYGAVRAQAGARRHSSDIALLTFAGIAALSLLAVYHRVYDAVLILPAFGWALLNLSGERRVIAWAVLACGACFLLPGASMLVVLGHAGVLGWLPSTLIWRVLIVPHQTWCLCALVALTIRALHGSTSLATEAWQDAAA